MSDTLYVYTYKKDGSIYKEEMQYLDKFRGNEILYHRTPTGEMTEVHRMSNPYIYAQEGITPDDINDYEFKNAVPAISYGGEDGNAFSITLPKGWKLSDGNITGNITWEDKEPVQQQCICDSMDLFRYGCKCGGV